MLGKKGAGGFEDGIETIAVVVAVIVYGFVLNLMIGTHSLGVQEAIASTGFYQNEVVAVDTHFLGTDLLNILKLEVTEDKSLAEALTYVPENLPENQDTFLLDNGLFTLDLGAYGCSAALQEKINSYIGMYEENWRLTAYNENEDLVFHCIHAPRPIILYYSTNMTLPATNGETMTVFLEVWDE